MNSDMNVLTVRSDSAFSRVLRLCLTIAAIALAVYGIYKFVDRYSLRGKRADKQEDDGDDFDDSDEYSEDGEGVEIAADDVLNEAESDLFDDVEPVEVPEKTATEA